MEISYNLHVNIIILSILSNIRNTLNCLLNLSLINSYVYDTVDFA